MQNQLEPGFELPCPRQSNPPNPVWTLLWVRTNLAGKTACKRIQTNWKNCLNSGMSAGAQNWRKSGFRSGQFSGSGLKTGNRISHSSPCFLPENAGNRPFSGRNPLPIIQICPPEGKSDFPPTAGLPPDIAGNRISLHRSRIPCLFRLL